MIFWYNITTLSLKSKSLFSVLCFLDLLHSWDKCINWTRSHLAGEYGTLNFPVPCQVFFYGSLRTTKGRALPGLKPRPRGKGKFRVPYSSARLDLVHLMHLSQECKVTWF